MFKEKEVVIRKTRRCDWCSEIVEAKSNAYIHTGKFDGHFFTSTLHPECRDAGCSDSSITEDGYQPGQFQRGSILLR